MKKAMLLRTCAAFALPLAVATALPVAAAAQQITTEITGQVQSEAGQPLSGATVTITDTRTGASQDFSTGSEGRFSASGLTTGGPYSVTVTAGGYQGQTLNDIFTNLQGATDLAFRLAAAAGETTEQTITVTGARARVTQLATGPGQSFGADVLQNAPSFNRDVRDVIRIDPRVSLDRDDLSGSDRISCLGGNDRGNAFTVDGIAQSDVYGLNDTGFSTRTATPIPFDAIRETQVQFAPYDVEYGQFTGCAVNVVTRSGSNRVRATGFFERTGDEWTGSRADNNDIDVGNTFERRWGVTVGAPIIRDRLFVFAAFERNKGAESQDEGPLNAGYTTELNGITEAQFDQISEILSDTYGVETGPLARNLPFDTKRWFLRGDLQITDNHRLEATYQRVNEFQTRSDDFFTSQNSPGITGLNTFYRSGSKSDFYSARLFSRWTDRISTELRFSRSDIQDIQDPVGGGEAQDNFIPRFLVGTTNIVDGTTFRGTVLAGPGGSRSANDLKSQIDQGKAAVRIDLGSHKVKFGAEFNKADVFNLFVQNATGTFVFRSIADLQAGLLSPGLGGLQTSTTPANVTGGNTEGFFINATETGDITTAAADFKRTIWSAYVQDDWKVTDRLDVVLGLRADFYSGDNPAYNENFFNRYGVRNDAGFDAIDTVILPRIAATYDLGDGGFYRRAKVRVGLGRFTGGDPLVWFGNAFQNDGQAQALGTTQGGSGVVCPAGQIDVTPGGVFDPTTVQCAFDTAQTIAGLGQGPTQAIDPDIKMMTVWRLNLGLEGTLSFGSGLFDGWRVNADYIRSRYQNPFNIVDVSQAINPALGLNGFTIDGRPIYRSIELSRPSCTGELVSIGSPPQYRDLNAACFINSSADPARFQEYVLTNAKGYTSQIASLLLSKDIGRGLLTEGGNVYFSMGYAWSDAKDRRNLYNSTANSNYGVTAAFDRQNPEASTGFFNTRHNFTLSTSFREEFFKDLATKFGFTFVARSGRPYSLTFTGSGDFSASQAGSDNALLYVPTGVDDPNLSPLSNAAAVEDLVEFVNGLKCARKYRGESIPRNTCRNDTYYDLDLRFSQEIPGPARFFGKNDKLEVYAMFDNFLNFLDDNWNVFRRRDFGGRQDVADLASTGVDAQGRYVISSFTGGSFEDDNQLKTSPSLWRLKVGVSYTF